MTRSVSHAAIPRVQRVAERAFAAIEHFLHIEAVSGCVLLLAAIVALVWANSPLADSYAHLWHVPLGFRFGDLVVEHSLHFWINDGLMTLFFLVVGMEIRKEMHDGSLASLQQAALPLLAALGGVVLPALIYVALNAGGDALRGWAVPTATDIAFAVGVLALLGKSIPPVVRIFLLALAIIDDIVAVLIIALFYSDGLQPVGFAVAAAGILLVFALQAMGVGRALLYVLPGALVWFGLLKSGAHPTLAGVVLGLLTPVRPTPAQQPALDSAHQALQEVSGYWQQPADSHQLISPVRRLAQAQRELLPPVVRLQNLLHPWVAYAIMPLFALANAGVSLQGLDLSGGSSLLVMLGISLALLLGKPLGILLACFISLRLGWCRMPHGLNWQWLTLVGVLAGIGFTMSIFIAGLAFAGSPLLDAAKAGVLLGSLLAGVAGLLLGAWLVRRKRDQ